MSGDRSVGPAATGGFVGSGQAVVVLCFGRAPVVEVGEFDGSGFEVVIHGDLVVYTEGECSGDIIVIHRDIIPVTGGEGICLHRDGSLVVQIVFTTHFVAGFIPECYLLSLHAAIDIPCFYFYLYIVGGSLEFEPDVFQAGVSGDRSVGPAATGGFVGSGQAVVVLCVGRAPVVEVGELDGPGFKVIVFGNLVVYA